MINQCVCCVVLITLKNLYLLRSSSLTDLTTSCIMIIYAILTLLFLFFFFERRNYNYWKRRGVPFDPPFLFFGSLYTVATRRESIFDLFRAIYRQHNTPYVGIHLFTLPFLMLRDPELIKNVLVKDFDKFVNRGHVTKESVDPMVYHSLMGAQGDNWKNLRQKITPIFSSGKIKLMFPLIRECAKDLNCYLANHSGERMEIKKVVKKYTVDVISSCAFGVNANCLKEENTEMLDMATRLVDMKSLVRNIAFFSTFFIPVFVDLFRLTIFDKKAANYLLDVFKSTMKKREEMKIVRNDLIDLLNNMKKQENVNDSYKFDELKMASQAIGFFMVGNDTSCITITFALFELALNQEVQNRLREEVRATFGNKENLNYEDIQEMKYLDMVFNETLRKHSALSFLNRKSSTKYTFEDTGLTLEKGANILIPIWALHYDPKYFPDPEKFDPERFSDENRKNIKPYTYLPFGEGPRNCIGQRFGVFTVKLGLAYAVKNLTFELTDKSCLPLKHDPQAFLLESEQSIYLKITEVL